MIQNLWNLVRERADSATNSRHVFFKIRSVKIFVYTRNHEVFNIS